MQITTRTCACGKPIEGHPARRHCTACRPPRNRTAWKDAHKTPEAKATRRAYFGFPDFSVETGSDRATLKPDLSVEMARL